MALSEYITRLQNGGALPAEIIAARVESGCSDCGTRLCLPCEIEVRVCGDCQSLFLREVSNANTD